MSCWRRTLTFLLHPLRGVSDRPPALLDVEVVAVLRGLVLGGHLTASEALDCPLLTRDARLRKASGHRAHVEVL